MPPWGRGQTIVVQDVWRGRLWTARPLLVVADDGDRLVLWCPVGAGLKVPTMPPTRPRLAERRARFEQMLARCDWVMRDHAWDVSTLWCMRTGDWYASWVSWRPSGEHWGWYINLQEPFRRTERGIQTMDLMLDVVVAPDLSWRMKDEDEFAMLTDARLIASETAALVRAESVSAIRRLERREEPFQPRWADWRPDPSWPVPVLPRGWDELGG